MRITLHWSTILCHELLYAALYPRLPLRNWKTIDLHPIGEVASREKMIRGCLHFGGFRILSSFPLDEARCGSLVTSSDRIKANFFGQSALSLIHLCMF